MKKERIKRNGIRNERIKVKKNSITWGKENQIKLKVKGRIKN